MFQARQKRQLLLRFFACGLLGLMTCGCETMRPSLVACPMPVVEQAARIQKLVPIGTPREKAVAQLKQAGIDGTFGTANSIFYCDTWTQSDKERWHIDVELLFNESGEVYAYRPDPQRFATASGDAGISSVSKPPKEIAAGPKSSVIDPFAE